MVAVLGEVAKELHPYQAAAAAQRIRAIEGDEPSEKLLADVADALESAVTSRSSVAPRSAAAEEEVPGAVGVLDEGTVEVRRSRIPQGPGRSGTDV